LLVGMIATLAFAPVAEAQLWQPFIDPGYFDYDLQFFAPAADIDPYGGPIQRTGWFGAYDRMYIGISRPDFPANYTNPFPDTYTTQWTGSVDPDPSHGIDSAWGNRWDVGYMIDDVNHDHGWLFSAMRIGSPNANHVVHQQRINRLNEDDDGFVVTSGSSSAGTTVEPDSDRNNAGPPNRERFYDITNSLNSGSMNSVELNKIFRTEPLNHGGILEPFFGVRYIQFKDNFSRQFYQTYDDNGVTPDPGWPPAFPIPVIPPGQVGGTGVALTDATVEDLASDRFCFTNDMFGGQLGLRWLKRANRWNLNSELRVFAMQNWQKLHRSFTVERTFYDGPGENAQVTAIFPYKLTQDWSDTSIMVGTDIRAEVAYEFTRDVHLNVGTQYLGFYNGIGRGPDINHNSQALNALGLTFGVVVNR
jgi:hypothetical protein